MNEFKPPDPLIFSGNISENWRRWSQRFNLYLTASGKVNEDGKTKVAILLHLLGEEGIEIFNNFTWTPGNEEVEAEDPDNLATVLDKLTNYCNPRKNTVMERYMFWEIKQKDGETVDQFVNELKTKAKNCEFGDQTNLMIRDRIIFGIQDEQLKERLLRTSENPTLERVVEMCRATEISKNQIKTLKGEIPIEALKRKGRYDRKHQMPKAKSHNSYKGRGAVASENPTVDKFECSKCGTRHGPRECPAYGKKCNVCKKFNHFAKKCRSSRKNVHVTEIDTDEEDPTFFCGVITINTITNEEKAWYSLIQIKNKTVKFKLDTGAEANVIPKSLVQKLGVKQLRQTKSKLSTYGNNIVNPLGKTKLICGKNGTTTEQELDFYVVNFKSTPILGLQACKSLKLLEKVEVMEARKQNLTLKSVFQDFEDNFKGLGKFEGSYKIELTPNCIPVVNPPRVVPQTIMPKLKETLNKLEKDGVIVPVEQATDWVNNLVIVEKKNGSLRLCLDPRELNKAIKRQHYQIPTLRDVTSKLSGKTTFSILDEKDGYHQVELDDSSSLLCTFQTPFGRYRYTRMPFGISSASEVFQRKNIETFGDIQGVHMIHDDMIIAAVNEDEHDEILLKVMKRAQEKNIKFNKDKMQFKVKEVKYMGSILNKDGCKPDPEKVKAIVEIPDPEDKKGVERLLGTVNFLAPFIPNMSQLTSPIRKLLRKDVSFLWQHEEKAALDKIKTILTSDPVLKFYDVTKDVTIQTDASQEGLGSCLLQNGHPIAYASRALTETEKNYAQIERELLAIVFACEKFNQYIYGKTVTVQTDHKPLQTIQNKPLHKIPTRLQRMFLRLQKYDLVLHYTPGKNMYIADTLSRAYIEREKKGKTEMEEEMETMLHSVVINLPFSDQRLHALRVSTENDIVLKEIKRIVKEGWPHHKKSLPEQVKPYWNFQEEIHIAEELVFVGDRIVIPADQQEIVLAALHESHLGIEKCKARARTSVYWPNMTRDIERICSQCSICNTYKRKNQKETLMQHEVPERPWQKVGIDLFEYKSHDYVLVVDFYSKFIEIRLLQGKTAKSVVNSIMTIYSVHGFPEEVIADNMPFNSKYFLEFGKTHNIKISTSSPTHSQSNGMAERSIQTIKNLLRKANADGKDEHIALLEYRNTPLANCNYSPAQLLMNRMLRDKVPTKPELLHPKIPQNAREQLLKRQITQKEHYDKSAKDMKDLDRGDSVRYRVGKTWEPAVVVNKHNSPRSYLITNEYGHELRRNRVHLQKTNENPIPIMRPNDQFEENASGNSSHQDDNQQRVTQSRSLPEEPPSYNSPQLRARRNIKKPLKYRDDNFSY